MRSLREWCGNVARIISSPLQCVSNTADPKGHCGLLRIICFQHTDGHRRQLTVSAFESLFVLHEAYP